MNEKMDVQQEPPLPPREKYRRLIEVWIGPCTDKGHEDKTAVEVTTEDPDNPDAPAGVLVDFLVEGVLTDEHKTKLAATFLDAATTAVADWGTRIKNPLAARITDIALEHIGREAIAKRLTEGWGLQP